MLTTALTVPKVISSDITIGAKLPLGTNFAVRQYVSGS